MVRLWPSLFLLVASASWSATDASQPHFHTSTHQHSHHCLWQGLPHAISSDNDQQVSVTFDYPQAAESVSSQQYLSQLNFAKGNAIRIGQQWYSLSQLHFHLPSTTELQSDIAMIMHLHHHNEAGDIVMLSVPLRYHGGQAASKADLDAWLASLSEQQTEHWQLQQAIYPEELLDIDGAQHNQVEAIKTAAKPGVQQYSLQKTITITPQKLAQLAQVFTPKPQQAMVASAQ
ncbi:hypothetical protein [Motilimonas pumila]|uniref:Carbonic anhydrase family protein n=1 Tax=Motilimonas pumila TaxID=2303987 RepID=A0A418YCA8_9GAMM|nr:hypothetical protein [Motilimonas pumila]RJG42102.1 hypothetical protein D1Z90_15060 [Motilimonas pumila]